MLCSVPFSNVYPQLMSHEGQKSQQVDEDYGDDDDNKERRKIEIKFIADKGRRHITFSKRKAGIMKKVMNAACQSRATTSRTNLL